ncbi:zinc-dependent metalloprotease [Cellulomonas sp. KRMCY2]|uniref:zinc-dependent metalloprotease n=1 Tax=Cellulomonas sp. KRMCY2 TaxID=1304865 RepID=UPI00045EB126|nr:zinc-dependent metalloprotease [Cellulomonas sp. KRMCY2]
MTSTDLRATLLRHRRTTTTSAASIDVDWDAAGRWGGRLASPGPAGSRAELDHLVADLHDAARRAVPLALRAARLGTAVEAAGTAGATAQVLVVDRAGWARAAAQSFAGMTGLPTDGRSGTGPATATAQVAGLLGLLAGRILGQFDPFAAQAPPAGRLLVVAPNVLKVERALGAEPSDFRLWVCVHEQTHALQFAAAPWLADHLRAEVAALVGDLAGELTGGELTGALTRLLRARGAGDDANLDADDDAALGLLELFLDPGQRDRVERITAVMSVLEGHADVSMDAVGPSVIPSVKRLRSRFEARRRTATGIDRVLRRLLGMDAKMAQYRRGAAFVRTVRRVGGRNALDAVWSGPAALPTPREIADPRAWVRRVHG